MKFIVLSLLILAGPSLAPAADGNSMAGPWKIHSSIAGYESDLDCTFTQDKQDVAGTCKNGEATLTMTGKLDEKKVTFQYKTVYEGQDLTIVHSGTFESSTKIVGSVDVQPMGVSGDFTASQSK